ncbi:unnamed protein product [Gadus morhua 'NCC']
MRQPVKQLTSCLMYFLFLSSSDSVFVGVTLGLVLAVMATGLMVVFTKTRCCDSGPVKGSTFDPKSELSGGGAAGVWPRDPPRRGPLPELAISVYPWSHAQSSTGSRARLAFANPLYQLSAGAKDSAGSARGTAADQHTSTTCSY